MPRTAYVTANLDLSPMSQPWRRLAANGSVLVLALALAGCDRSKPAEAEATKQPSASADADTASKDADPSSCPEGMRAIEGSAAFQLGPYVLRDGTEHAAEPIEVSSFCLDTTEVTFEQAQAYCVAQAKRLPTSAEWEFAAKAGAEQRRYPWGAEPPSAAVVNGCGPSCLAQFETSDPPDYDPDDAWLETAPVGSFVAGNSRDGVSDLAGNVFEWTTTHRCSDGKPGACEGEPRVIRGGGFDPQGGVARFATNTLGSMIETMGMPHVGFRCAR
jgi:formylglycine-generating enzyme required for sulfatase activity